MRTFFSLAIRISAFATDDISITRYNCRLTWTDLKILPKFGDQHSIYLGFLRWLNWSVLKNLWKISIVIFSKPLRCVQRKPSTVEVLNFTKRPEEKKYLPFITANRYSKTNPPIYPRLPPKALLSNNEPYVDFKYVRTSIAFFIVLSPFERI